MTRPTVEERRWLQALENARIGVWDLDPRLETVHYSPAWKARLGFPRVLAPDSTSFWRCRVHPEDVDTMLLSLRSHLDGHAESYTMRFRLRSNGSGYRTMLSRGRVVERDRHGVATRMVGTMVDLTARPVVTTRHGLASEDPHEAHGSAPVRRPLHAVLGAADPVARALVERIDDLLELALRDAAP
jgi:hypothetical protein